MFSVRHIDNQKVIQCDSYLFSSVSLLCSLLWSKPVLGPRSIIGIGRLPARGRARHRIVWLAGDVIVVSSNLHTIICYYQGDTLQTWHNCSCQCSGIHQRGSFMKCFLLQYLLSLCAKFLLDSELEFHQHITNHHRINSLQIFNPHFLITNYYVLTTNLNCFLYFILFCYPWPWQNISTTYFGQVPLSGKIRPRRLLVYDFLKSRISSINWL